MSAPSTFWCLYPGGDALIDPCVDCRRWPAHGTPGQFQGARECGRVAVQHLVNAGFRQIDPSGDLIQS